MVDNKYMPATLPEDPKEALSMAEIRESWATQAISLDKMGSAREFELTALLLKQYAAQLANNEAKPCQPTSTG